MSKPLSKDERLANHFRASGMREISMRLSETAGNLFRMREDDAAKCYRTASDLALDLSNALLKEGRYAPKARKRRRAS